MKNKIETTITLPLKQIKHLQKIADLAEVKLQTVIKVVLAKYALERAMMYLWIVENVPLWLTLLLRTLHLGRWR